MIIYNDKFLKIIKFFNNDFFKRKLNVIFLLELTSFKTKPKIDFTVNRMSRISRKNFQLLQLQMYYNQR